MSLTFKFTGGDVAPEHYNETYGVLNNYAEQARFLCSLLRKHSDRPSTGSIILDVGCGTGALAEHLTRSLINFPFEYLGIDPEERFIEYAQQRELKNARFECASFPTVLESIPYCTLILFSTYLLQSVDDINSLADAVQSALAHCNQNGAVVFSFFDEQAYRFQFEDGPFSIVLPSEKWCGRGWSEFDSTSGKRYFELNFSNRMSGVMFGSAAEYLPLTRHTLRSALRFAGELQFYPGEDRGLERDGTRWWCYVRPRH